MEPQVQPNQVTSHFQAALMNLDYLLKMNPYYSCQKDHDQAKLAFAQIMSALVIAFEKEKLEKKETEVEQILEKWPKAVAEEITEE